MILGSLLVNTLETVINNYLALDKNSNVYLKPLAGKVIAVTIQPFAKTIYLCPTHDTVQCLDYAPEQPDTRIAGSPWALGLMGVSSKPMRSIFNGAVTIEGNMETARKFQELFAKLDINLQAKLAPYTGNRFANNLGQFFRTGQTWSKDSIASFQLNLTEFLQEETRNLPASPEIDIYYRQIDELRMDYDRLQSRIERLERALPENINPQE